MTYHPFEKYGRWFYSLYLSFIPMLLCIFLLKLVLEQSNAHFNKQYYLLIIFGLWGLCYALTVIASKKPFEKIFFDKYKWFVQGKAVYNKNKSIEISEARVEKIYPGFSRPNEADSKSKGSLHNSLKALSGLSSIIVILKSHQIIFFQFAALTNGEEVENFIKNNFKAKIEKQAFDIDAYKEKHSLKFFQLMDYKP